MGSWRRGQLRVLSRRRKAMRERHAFGAGAEGPSGLIFSTEQLRQLGDIGRDPPCLIHS